MDGTSRTSDAYPTREPHFGQRFRRLLVQPEVATSLGVEAAHLLFVILQAEEDHRFRQPAKFTNDQLMPACGVGGIHRLIGARTRASSEGWLHYAPANRHQPGLYWVCVPEKYLNNEDACPAESARQETVPALPNQHGKTVPALPNQHGKTVPAGPSPAESARQGETKNLASPYREIDLNTKDKDTPPPPAVQVSVQECGAGPGDSRGYERADSTPRNGTHPDAVNTRTAKRARSAYPDRFEAFWLAYPHRVGKAAAHKAWVKALAMIRQRKDWAEPVAHDWLMGVVKKYATSRYVQSCLRTPDDLHWIPHPATWLNDARYDDDQSTWERPRPGANGRNTSRPIGRAEKYDPSNPIDETF